MKTVMISNEIKEITYKTNTGVYTRLKSPTGRVKQYGADIYTVNDDGKHIVLVATSFNGSELKSTVTILSAEHYALLADMHDPYNDLPFHNAIMAELNFT